MIFVLAFSLRLAYLSQVKTSPLFYPPSSGLDDSLYHHWAESIAHGDLLGQGAFNAMPFYPYFLGLIYKLFGSSILIAKIIQFILGSFSCLLIYFIAKRIFGNAPNRIITQGCRIARNKCIMGELFSHGIEPVEPIARADPQFSIGIFKYHVDPGIAQ